MKRWSHLKRRTEGKEGEKKEEKENLEERIPLPSLLLFKNLPPVNQQRRKSALK